MAHLERYAFHAGGDAARPAPVRWAMDKLAESFARHGVAAADAPDVTIAVLDSRSEAAGMAAREAGVALPQGPESFALLRFPGRIVACGWDARGLVYALTELADRLDHADSPALDDGFPLVEAPATAIRSMSRAFVSEVEDKPWFHDATQWLAYLDMLVANRFNRFSLALGMGYDYPYQNNLVSDVYFYFPYPYLVAVPGYEVRVAELPDAERARNLDMLRLIGREAARRGLDFQLALWTQRYDFETSPGTNYTVRGVTDGMLGPYCRDAVAMLLKEVPEITGLTFRIHVEGGISEGDYDFWRLVFAGVRSAGRQILIDMHAKGLDETTLNVGLESGMPVGVSPKYLAEHMGLPYHPSAIREREYPPAEAMTNREKLSVGSRRFMRQSYGDMLPADKNWNVVFRVWPGTQRLLAWGDPALAAAYGRSGSFAGADGIEWMEPLTFKGRQGTGIRGGRMGFRDMDLATGYDWEKYLLQYRLFGRLSFSPDAAPESWQRHLRARCGDAAGPVECAMAAASKILPLMTQTHAPSIANNNYWPEIYTNIAVLGDNRHRPFGDDMDGPIRFGNVPTFDSQIFANAREYVADLIGGNATRRYTPFDIADWMECSAEQAEIAIAQAKSKPDSARAAVRGLLIDTTIVAALGRFFAAKFRASCWAELYLLAHQPEARARMIACLRQGRDAWRVAAKLGEDVYPADITFGPGPHLRGSWQQRDGDVERELRDALAFRFREGETPPLEKDAAARVLNALHNRQPVRCASVAPEAPAHFRRGSSVTIRQPVIEGLEHVLHYRHVNQAERWRSAPMRVEAGHAVADIPADYTDSRYHLQFYVSAATAESCVLSPGLPPSLAAAPYVTILQT